MRTGALQFFTIHLLYLRSLSISDLKLGSNLCPIQFDLEKHTLVFVHIQKTGGRHFDSILTHDITGQSCGCRDRNGISFLHFNKSKPKLNFKRESSCPCHRTISSQNPGEKWLITRSSTRWQGCGVHAPYAQLKMCSTHYNRFLRYSTQVPSIPFECRSSNPTSPSAMAWCKYVRGERLIFERGYIVGSANSGQINDDSYYFVTILRDPITRYLSEFKLAKRGSFWLSTMYAFGGKVFYDPPCYEVNRTKLKNLTLEEFTNCPNAANRMVRHMADPEFYQHVEHRATTLNATNHYRIMLESAKTNLRERFQAFAILERLSETRKLISAAFGFRFDPDSVKADRIVSRDVSGVSGAMLDKIKGINRMDIELYEYANNLFEERLQNLTHKLCHPH